MEPITFVFLLTLWTGDAPNANVFVEDAGLTASDCTTRMAAYNAASPTWERGVPSCEIDAGYLEESNTAAYAVEIAGEMHILYPCLYEDSSDCVWDSRWRGDGEGTGLGKGQSFADFGGVVYNLTFGQYDEITQIQKRN